MISKEPLLTLPFLFPMMTKPKRFELLMMVVVVMFLDNKNKRKKRKGDGKRKKGKKKGKEKGAHDKNKAFFLC
jgi:hypothetical protein